jgi:hypothetical protein
MTTFVVPPAGSPAWREIYPTPPDVRLDLGAGRWCPLDDTTLQIRLDGYGCPRCRAAWDFQGLSGRWLAEVTSAEVAPSVRWRPSALLVLAGLAGSAFAAAGLVALLSTLDEHLVLLFAAVIAAAAAAIVLVPLTGRIRDGIRDRHTAVCVPRVDGEVRDER